MGRIPKLVGIKNRRGMKLQKQPKIMSVAVRKAVREATNRLEDLEQRLDRFDLTDGFVPLMVCNKIADIIWTCYGRPGRPGFSVLNNTDRFLNAKTTLYAHETAYAAAEGITLDALRARYYPSRRL